MATQVNVYDAKTQLSRLIDRVLAGEEIVIARAGRPMVALVRLPEAEPRQPGLAKGRVTAAFFDLLPAEELDAWET